MSSENELEETDLNVEKTILSSIVLSLVSLKLKTLKKNILQKASKKC